MIEMAGEPLERVSTAAGTGIRPRLIMTISISAERMNDSAGISQRPGGIKAFLSSPVTASTTQPSGNSG